MGRRRALTFQPKLDPLEGRIAMSAAHPVAAIVATVPQAAPPDLTRQTFDWVLAKIDKAFVSYKGQDTSGVLNTIGGIVSAITAPNNGTDPNSNDTDSSFVSGGEGDSGALEARLSLAVARIPFERAKTPSLLNEVFGLGGMTTLDSNFFHDLFKKLVHRDVNQDIKSGVIVMKPATSHHRAG